jgi:hypothetical protein
MSDSRQGELKMNSDCASANLPGDIYVRSVTTPQGEALGWAVCVLVDEALLNTAANGDVSDTQQADLLILRQYCHQWEAESAQRGFYHFIRENRRLIGKLASQRELWESAALSQSESTDIDWIIMEGEALSAFHTGKYAIICDQKDWHLTDPLTDAFERHPEMSDIRDKVRHLLNEALPDSCACDLTGERPHNVTARSPRKRDR